MKKLFFISLIVLTLVLSGCSPYKKIIGVIEKDPGSSLLSQGCGYCFTSDDGNYQCALLAGGVNVGDFSGYLGKKVFVYAKPHTGAVSMMCPVTLDVERVELSK